MELVIGELAPNFTLVSHENKKISLSDFRGQYVVVFMYPKDDTSGCTKECISFSEHLEAFSKLNAVLLGISRDSTESHVKFIKKYGLNITLLTDDDMQTLKAYGSWVEKSMYGKKYMGVDRSTFIINPDGNIAEIYRKVKVPQHVEKVLKRLEELCK